MKMRCGAWRERGAISRSTACIASFGVRAREVEEDAADPLQRRAAALQRLDGVGESGQCRVARDRVDLGALRASAASKAG